MSYHRWVDGRIGVNEGSEQDSSRGRRRRTRAIGNVTRDLTTFVGREEELRELKSLVGRSRLVTVLGPGGIGKSRLARELAVRLEPLCPGGVWLVELAEVTNPHRIPSAVARAVGILEHGSNPLEDRITAALSARTLLILDNCEHVIDASARLAATLLHGSPHLRILATSREPLEIDGERTFLVDPLPLPEPERGVIAGDDVRYAGLRLFVDRLVSRDRMFRVTDENLELVASVCSSVGGMPLAIELAASRAAHVSLATLHDQLGEQLAFENLRRDAPSRHRTMRSTLASSHDMLTAEERELWKRLATFSGGATPQAARAVCEFGTLSGDRFESALMGLVEKSIVLLDSRASETRYRMLEPVRLFGLEQARVNDEERELRRAHLHWCSGLIPQNAWLEGDDQQRWMRTFERDHSNIATSLDYCLSEPDELEAGLELFAATFLFWGLQGWYREERHYAEALVAASRSRSRTRSFVRFAAGFTAWYTYDLETASRRFHETAQAAGRDQRVRGLARFGLGVCALSEESYAEAARLLRDASEQLESSQTNVFLANARYHLSQAYILGFDDVDAARDVLGRNLDLTAAGDVWNHAMTHAQLGSLAWRDGEFDDAESHLHRAVELQVELGHHFGLAASLEALAWVAASKGEQDRAAQLLGSADAIFNRLGTTVVPGLLPYHETATATARTSLGPERFNTLRQTGSRMDVEHVVSLARGEGGSAAAATDTTQALTTRELEVAELVARGATNAQISFELMIALETVKTHVRSILRKLGFESRVQIAGWYSTHGSEQKP
jgi:non-specific serine/threonine protein kinase